MSAEWKAELEKLKQQPIEETMKMQKKEVGTEESYKSELRKLMKLLKAQLTPVVEVFIEEGKTKTQQPHIHEYKIGYTLVLPIAKPGLKPTILRLQFEFQLTEKGYVLKAKRETGKTTGPERIIVAPITEEEIHNEIREVIKERQSMILKLKNGES
ncbi:hypothetical protein JXA31_02000 [Candidatus Bathyarchaeota archaeon]|nr:hypothetical protein [Candidatus Bathyarchaeota archaeon]